MGSESNQDEQTTVRKFSPVVRADVKFYGKPPFLCVDARFESGEQLDALIEALIKLRDRSADSFDHVHLQDFECKSASSNTQGIAAEVTFWRPSTPRDEIAADCVKVAKKFLKRGS